MLNWYWVVIVGSVSVKSFRLHENEVGIRHSEEKEFYILEFISAWNDETEKCNLCNGNQNLFLFYMVVAQAKK